MNDREQLERCLAFALGLERDAAEEVVRYPGGYALLSPSLSKVWDSNLLLVEDADLEVERIVELADELIGGAGMAHRTILAPDSQVAEPLAPGFRSLGWEVGSDVYMVRRRVPDRLTAVAIREVRGIELEHVRRAFVRQDLPAEKGSDALIEQLLERERRFGGVGGDRWFAAESGGRTASFCRLLARDRIAQVEDVGTLAFAQGRGLARAVVLAACEAAAADASEIIFLSARAEDWPRRLYARLGFDELGSSHWFRRKP